MMSDQFSKDINFQKVLFLHINRTGISIIQPLLFTANVEFLEMLLSPYKDKDYSDEIKLRGAGTSIASLDPLCGAKEGMAQIQEIKKAAHMFRCLMSLSERKGLLLEKTDSTEEWNLPEEEV